ncbi:MAG: DUF192 domain-containing protein [Patescibacteria group bacterium]
MRLIRLLSILIATIIFSSIIFLFFLKTPTPRVLINGKSFNAEIVKSSKDQAIGLAKYKKISKDFGMLFIFDNKGYYGFWMKNMKFPIDIIFISDNKITTIFKNVDYPKNGNSNLQGYKPDVPSDMVFEVNAGISNKYNFQKGDSVKINY